MVEKKQSRRRFLEVLGRTAVGAAGVTVFQGGAVRAGRVGPNDKIRLALIGIGGMGGRHLEALSRDEQCEVVALCDCYTKRYEMGLDRYKEWTGGKETVGYQDFRPVLDRSDVDAVLVATPDHWHPLITILACEAGKDVYVEKPVCTTVTEGRAMVEAARRYGRVVQVGTQQRSMEVFQRAVRLIRSGKLGRITSAGCWIDTNKPIEVEHPGPVPEGLDWDLWLGPAPKVPYSRERYFDFRHWHDYARGGELTNWGVHLIDIVHWVIEEDRPLSVQALGGSYRKAPGSENYETIDVLFEYKGCTVTWEQRHSNSHHGRDYGMMFQGTEGCLVIDRNGFVVKPDSLGIGEYFGEPERSWAHPPHHHNFFECVRSRRLPVADIETGFRSTTAVLLAGIALKTRRKLYWDGDSEKFIRDEQANRYLSRAYRYPWHL